MVADASVRGSYSGSGRVEKVSLYSQGNALRNASGRSIIATILGGRRSGTRTNHNRPPTDRHHPTHCIITITVFVARERSRDLKQSRQEELEQTLEQIKDRHGSADGTVDVAKLPPNVAEAHASLTAELSAMRHSSSWKG